MITLIIFIVLYLLSVWYNFVSVRKIFYHPKGFGYGNQPDNMTYFLSFAPFLNFVNTFALLILGWKSQEYKTKNNIFHTNKYDHLKE